MSRILSVLVAVAVLGVGGAAAATPPGTQPPGGAPTTSTSGDESGSFDDTQLVQVARDCDVDLTHIMDEGHSLVFDDVMSGSDGMTQAMCVLAAFPDWVREMVESTTSVWGLVRTEVRGFVILNSYHPDNGMFLVIYEADCARTTDEC